MKSYHAIRSIDQKMGSELAAPEPKWGVATRVGADTPPVVAATYSSKDWPLAHHAVRGWN